jgi:hypothetical protein
LKVKLTYWTSGDAEFELQNRWGLSMRKVMGPSCWHPETRYKRNLDGTFTAPKGPEYVIVTIRGVVDVVEHDHVPAVFRMTDNDTVIREAKESIARGECKHQP